VPGRFSGTRRGRLRKNYWFYANMNNINEINWSEKELGDLKGRILRRVYAVWFFKKVLIPAFSALAVSGAILFYAIKAQHVAVISQNISNRLAELDLVGLAKYLLVAVQKTELDLFALSASATLLAMYFGRRLIRETLNFWLKGSAKTVRSF